MAVVSIHARSSRTVVEQLEFLLEQARQGKYAALAFAVKEPESRKHGVGLVGDYERDPGEVLMVLGRLHHRINQLMDREF